MSTNPDPAVRSAQKVVDVVSAQGVQYVFGVPGAKIDAVYDALLDGGPQLVVCRHEQNAAFIAGAIGRLTGTPGVVLVTSGPGTTNLVTGLLTANTEQDPVVALCGAVGRKDRLKRTHQSMDAAALLRTVTKFTGEVNDPDNVAEAVVAAFRAAVGEPRGAAAVVLPLDVLTASTTAGITGPTPIPPLASAPAQAVRHAGELIRNAHRPALLVGIRGADPASTQALRALVAATGLPVVETFQGAGVISRALEDNFLGRVGLFRNQPGDVILAHADALITVGYDAVEYDPVLWNNNAERTIVHLDAVPADIDNHYQPTVELLGAVAASLTALTTELAGLALTDGYRDEIARQRKALRDIDIAECAHVPDGPGLNPVAVVLALRDELDDEATIACDVGSVYIFMARHFRVYEPRRLLFSNGQQTLGVALPWAIAACLARPATPVVSVSGDGGFLFSAQELETATRLGLNFTHIIFRDNGYDMVGFQEVLKYGRKSGVQLGDYDVVSYAAAFGARGYRVKTLDEFRTTLRQALAEDGPSLIDVPVDYHRNTELAAHLHDDAFE
ncbi:acetolactate synthase AlsS [Mycobacterium sherrisii]|uniref:acetolactate synthase n=1 Tax=Mycobacterium sherrisii TaxID=243061 RepID=A0A1E3SXX7_9MYCO|nr:acetolactate synthase AlsS [Mycobacterium sherrisii]MEC4763388.1 acetolactate synthase AlsS [Mycobacterium sherrisii]ODR07016.1 acetolactate synthase [Mycobacterium sherrisii]ORW72785.1 acetolactate synthase [Mycobacterium sherrisii]